MTSRGELEQRVMQTLWATNRALTVAEVHARLNNERELAYTTVMTVLDRLAKKRLVTRELIGRAWAYLPAQTQAAALAKSIMALLSGVEPQIAAEALATASREMSAS